MKNKTIKQQINDLQKLVEWFEGDEFELEMAKEKFELAEKLADEIRQKLTTLKNEITIIDKQFDQE